MKVGVLTSSISRKSGGLLSAINPLTKRLSVAGCEVKIFSGKDSYTKADLVHWKSLDVKIVNQFGPHIFGYMPNLSSLINEADLDLLHTHGMWKYVSIASLQWQRKMKRPLIISPHGMLDPWAIKNSGWKKVIAAFLYEKSHLSKAACIHALCYSEYESIRAYGLKNPVAVIPNGVEIPTLSLNQPNWSLNLTIQKKVLLFLGRIHPKKGLVNLLNAWAHMHELEPKAKNWQLVIAGWEEGEHETELKLLVEKLELKESVHFIGPQFDEQKELTLARVDAFVLPSFSEGLPMVVLEAWSYKLPVIMTAQCNLKEGFDAHAAIEITTDIAGIADGLLRLFCLPDMELRNMGQRGLKLVETQFSWSTIAADMFSVYNWVIERRHKPPCVIID